MKWFKVDADAPNDPKIRALLSELGNEGLGALFLLWCHIADHGERRPGWSIDAAGRPIPESVLMSISGLEESKWRTFIENLLKSHHILSKPWTSRRVIAIPAMSRRADTYTQRVVRTGFEQSSKSLRTKFPRREEKRSEEKRREARVARGRNGLCPHSPTCPSRDECIALILWEGKQQKAES